MSLSLLIERDKDLRNKIRGDFQLPVLRLKFEKTRPLLAPPKTPHSRLVGVAFDYLLRFYLERTQWPPISPRKSVGCRKSKKYTV